MSGLDLDLNDFGINLNDDIETNPVDNKVDNAEEQKAPEPIPEPEPTPSKSDDEGDDPKSNEEEKKTDNEEDQPKEPETPQEPEEPEEQLPQAEPITKDDLRSMLTEIRSEERLSSRQLEIVQSDIESRYYPNGISKVMVDSETGKPIRTAQDVIDLSGNPDLTIEQAESWRLQKQSEWDANVRDIESTIRKIAEQTVSLAQGTENVMNRYADLFKAHPQLERKVTAQYLKTVTIDKNTGTVLAAPNDIEEYFDTMLEPYKLAFEASQQQVAPAQPQAPEQPKPTKNDRLDEFGDGAGAFDDDDADPDDFEAQLSKEFNRE